MRQAINDNAPPAPDDGRGTEGPAGSETGALDAARRDALRAALALGEEDAVRSAEQRLALFAADIAAGRLSPHAVFWPWPEELLGKSEGEVAEFLDAAGRGLGLALPPRQPGAPHPLLATLAARCGARLPELIGRLAALAARPPSPLADLGANRDREASAPARAAPVGIPLPSAPPLFTAVPSFAAAPASSGVAARFAEGLAATAGIATGTTWNVARATAQGVWEAVERAGERVFGSRAAKAVPPAATSAPPAREPVDERLDALDAMADRLLSLAACVDLATKDGPVRRALGELAAAAARHGVAQADFWDRVHAAARGVAPKDQVDEEAAACAAALDAALPAEVRDALREMGRTAAKAEAEAQRLAADAAFVRSEERRKRLDEILRRAGTAATPVDLPGEPDGPRLLAERMERLRALVRRLVEALLRRLGLGPTSGPDRAEPPSGPSP